MPQPRGPGDGMVSNFRPKEFSAEIDADLSVADVSGGYIHQGVTLTSDVIYTLPDAFELAAAWPGMDVGDAFAFVVTNAQAGAFDVVIAVNTNITAIGANNSLSVPPQSSRIFVLLNRLAAGVPTFVLF